MAENVQENRPPEPPPKPLEVPKPTERSNPAEAKDHGQQNETQQSAHQDVRNAVQSEYAKAMSGLQQAPEQAATRKAATAHDLRHPGGEHEVSRATTDDPPRPGDRGFNPGEHRGELRDDFRPGTHDPGGLFQEKERKIADRLAEDGASVHPRVRVDSVEGKKNPDSMVRTSPDDPGRVTEFKTLDRASSGAVRSNILAAGVQLSQYGGGDVVIDGRGVKLTDEDAHRGYARAFGQAKQMELPMPDRLMIIIGDGSIMTFPEE